MTVPIESITETVLRPILDSRSNAVGKIAKFVKALSTTERQMSDGISIRRPAIEDLQIDTEDKHFAACIWSVFEMWIRTKNPCLAVEIEVCLLLLRVYDDRLRADFPGGFLHSSQIQEFLSSQRLWSRIPRVLQGVLGQLMPSLTQTLNMTPHRERWDKLVDSLNQIGVDLRHCLRDLTIEVDHGVKRLGTDFYFSDAYLRIPRERGHTNVVEWALNIVAVNPDVVTCAEFLKDQLTGTTCSNLTALHKAWERHRCETSQSMLSVFWLHRAVAERVLQGRSTKPGFDSHLGYDLDKRTVNLNRFWFLSLPPWLPILASASVGQRVHFHQLFFGANVYHAQILKSEPELWSRIKNSDRQQIADFFRGLQESEILSAYLVEIQKKKSSYLIEKQQISDGYATLSEKSMEALRAHFQKKPAIQTDLTIGATTHRALLAHFQNDFTAYLYEENPTCVVEPDDPGTFNVKHKNIPVAHLVQGKLALTTEVALRLSVDSPVIVMTLTDKSFPQLNPTCSKFLLGLSKNLQDANLRPTSSIKNWSLVKRFEAQISVFLLCLAQECVAGFDFFSESIHHGSTDFWLRVDEKVNKSIEVLRSSEGRIEIVFEAILFPLYGEATFTYFYLIGFAELMKNSVDGKLSVYSSFVKVMATIRSRLLALNRDAATPVAIFENDLTHLSILRNPGSHFRPYVTCHFGSLECIELPCIAVDLQESGEPGSRFEHYEDLTDLSLLNNPKFLAEGNRKGIRVLLKYSSDTKIMDELSELFSLDDFGIKESDPIYFKVLLDLLVDAYADVQFFAVTDENLRACSALSTVVKNIVDHDSGTIFFATLSSRELFVKVSIIHKLLEKPSICDRLVEVARASIGDGRRINKGEVGEYGKVLKSFLLQLSFAKDWYALKTTNRFSLPIYTLGEYITRYYDRENFLTAAVESGISRKILEILFLAKSNAIGCLSGSSRSTLKDTVPRLFENGCTSLCVPSHPGIDMIHCFHLSTENHGKLVEAMKKEPKPKTSTIPPKVAREAVMNSNSLLNGKVKTDRETFEILSNAVSSSTTRGMKSLAVQEASHQSFTIKPEQLVVVEFQIRNKDNDGASKDDNMSLSFTDFCTVEDSRRLHYMAIKMVERDVTSRPYEPLWKNNPPADCASICGVRVNGHVLRGRLPFLNDHQQKLITEIIEEPPNELTQQTSTNAALEQLMFNDGRHIIDL